MEHDEVDVEIDTTDAGASQTEPKALGEIKKGDYVVMNDNRPCKVVAYSTAKTGKHGAAKAMYTGIDIFTGKKYEASDSTGHTVKVPFIDRKDFQVVCAADDGFLTLMNTETGDTRQDLKFPDDTEDDAKLTERIKDFLNAGTDCKVTVLKSMGIEKIIDTAELKGQ